LHTIHVFSVIKKHQVFPSHPCPTPQLPPHASRPLHQPQDFAAACLAAAAVFWWRNHQPSKLQKEFKASNTESPQSCDKNTILKIETATFQTN